NPRRRALGSRRTKVGKRIQRSDLIPYFLDFATTHEGVSLMSINVEDYFAPATFNKMKAFADQHETPFVVIDTATIARAYDEIADNFPFAKIYYAVKANPAVEITELLKNKGSNFDIASIYELDKVMSCGVKPEQISFGNTIKKA